MITYNVVMRRWSRGWEFHIEGVGVTQIEGGLGDCLDEADEMVRDYIRVVEGLHEPFQIAWHTIER